MAAMVSRSCLPSDVVLDVREGATRISTDANYMYHPSGKCYLRGHCFSQVSETCNPPSWYNLTGLLPSLMPRYGLLNEQKQRALC